MYRNPCPTAGVVVSVTRIIAAMSRPKPRFRRSASALALAAACAILCACDDSTSNAPPTAAPDSPANVAASDPPPATTTPARPSPQASYVGEKTCAECHQEQHDAWSGSDHDKAMAPATRDTVLADFNNTSFTKDGVTTRFFVDGDRFMVNTDGPDGKMADFQVKYTFGHEPLQQYLIGFPDGRVQCLTIAWDTHENRWFSLYPHEKLPHDDWLHWTKAGQNWNYMCAECHSTNLSKNYDLRTNTYQTSWSEINVTCEACHGPGSAHVKWAREAKESGEPYDFTSDLGLVIHMKDLDPQLRDPAVQKTQVEVCARCHSRRRIVYPYYRHDKPFLDSYAVELLRDDLYFPDGQIKDEVYVYGSFLQSLMYHKGVKCTDCHDPHTAKVVAPGNSLCVRCHEPAKFDTQEHHHHPIGSAGSLCVECHMRQRTYMQVDPRRDHGFRIPRPDLTVSLGIKNACNACHKDKTPQWTADQVVQWFGPTRRDDIHHAWEIAMGRAGRPEAEPKLAALVRKTEEPAIVRATALDLLATRYGDGLAIAAAQDALKDPDALVRGTAVRGLEHAPPDQLYEVLTPLLSDPIRFVRTEAARVLSRVANQRFSDRSKPPGKQFWSALHEYNVGQRAVEDQAGAHLNLAVIHENLDEPAQAEEEYRAAIRLDPTFVPARMNLAMLLNGHGRKAEAEALLLEAVRLQPTMAEAHYSLGLLIAEEPARVAEASRYLAEAARLAPDNARMQYNAGLARMQAGAPDEAEPFLLRAVKLQPQNPQFLDAAVRLYAQQQKWREALPLVQQLVAMYPAEPQFTQLLRYIQAKAGSE
jgi:predicted CXXCH cytochrome family protein